MAQSKTLNYNSKPSSGHTVGRKQFKLQLISNSCTRTYVSLTRKHLKIWIVAYKSSYHVIQQSSSRDTAVFLFELSCPRKNGCR